MYDRILREGLTRASPLAGLSFMSKTGCVWVFQPSAPLPRPGHVHTEYTTREWWGHSRMSWCPRRTSSSSRFELYLRTWAFRALFKRQFEYGVDEALWTWGRHGEGGVPYQVLIIVCGLGEVNGSNPKIRFSVTNLWKSNSLIPWAFSSVPVLWSTLRGREGPPPRADLPRAVKIWTRK